MVIIFSSHKARQHLLTTGQVYTVRTKKRKEEPFKPSKDWLTDRRGGRKIADVLVEYWLPIKRESLELLLQRYVKKSGFLTVNLLFFFN